MTYVQFAPRKLLSAARILASDPDDLPKVFTVIESLSVDTLDRIARRLRKSEAGRKMIASRPDIVDRLADRDALARLPAGSLGRAYLAFVERENISADGIRAAATAGMAHAADMPAPIDQVHARMRDTHRDLSHAATGYSGDIVGAARAPCVHPHPDVEPGHRPHHRHRARQERDVSRRRRTHDRPSSTHSDEG